MAFYHIYLQIHIQILFNGFQNLQHMIMETINYSFSFEKIIINRALFDQSLHKYLR
jgi:hypothetical protein